MNLVYSEFKFIYPGPHLDSEGNFDARVWFAIRTGFDELKGTETYLIFPHGADESEILEKEYKRTQDY